MYKYIVSHYLNVEPTDSTKAIAVGDSLYARLPARFCKSLDIKQGSPLIITKSGKRIIYKKEHDDDEPKPAQSDSASKEERTSVPDDGNNQETSPIRAAALAALRHFNTGHRSEPENPERDSGENEGSITEPEPPLKLFCNRIGCEREATHQGLIGDPPVAVALCEEHAIENAKERGVNNGV